jgi:hypothetical protein
MLGLPEALGTALPKGITMVIVRKCVGKNTIVK